MQFILAPENIDKLDNLRKDYQQKKGINLDTIPSMLSRPYFLGGVNIPTRKEQIEFIEKLKIILKINLFALETIDTPEKWQVNLIASKTLIAACLYVLCKIGSSKRNSVLYQLIENKLGITPTNFLDDEDIEACYITANRLIHTNNAFEHANRCLINEGKMPFTEREWYSFSEFLKTSCDKIESDHKKQANSFPVISITKPLFGSVFSYVGASVGIVTAEAFNNSTSAIASRQLATSLLVFIPAGTTGVAFLSSVIATRLVSSFCSISLAHIMGMSMKIMGQSVGIGIGAPFDLTYNLLWKICSVINRYYNKTPAMAEIDGIRITDGVAVLSGIPIQTMSEDTFPQGYTPKLIEINDAGEVSINEQEQIPLEAINEFQVTQVP